MPADDNQSSSWGSSQRPASHLRRSLAAAGRRSTRQTRLRTSDWMHQGGTMAHQQVHRSRWIACRRRSAAPSITISRLSRGKTVEKCPSFSCTGGPWGSRSAWSAGTWRRSSRRPREERRSRRERRARRRPRRQRRERRKKRRARQPRTRHRARRPRPPNRWRPTPATSTANS